MTSNTSVTQLIITAVGNDNGSLLSHVSNICKQFRCNILDSRLSNLGQDIAVYMLISGPWNGMAKLENSLSKLEAKMDLVMHRHRTEPMAATPIDPGILYSVQMTIQDRVGILYDLTQFFNKNGIQVIDSQTNYHLATQHRSAMSHIHLSVRIPQKVNVPQFRELFAEFCEDKNLDAYLEPLHKI